MLLFQFFFMGFLLLYAYVLMARIPPPDVQISEVALLIWFMTMHFEELRVAMVSFGSQTSSPKKNWRQTLDLFVDGFTHHPLDQCKSWDHTLIRGICAKSWGHILDLFCAQWCLSACISFCEDWLFMTTTMMYKMSTTMMMKKITTMMLANEFCGLKSFLTIGFFPGMGPAKTTTS